MELRAYWGVVRRRLWIIILVVVIAALYVAYQGYHLWKTPGALKAYHSSVTIQVGLQPAPRSMIPSYIEDMQVAEALADAVPNVVTLPGFDKAVSDQVGQDMEAIQARYGSNPDLGDWQNPGAIAGALSASRVHNLVTIDVSWPTAPGAWAIAQAVGEVLTHRLNTYLDYIIEGTPGTSLNTEQLQPAAIGRLVSPASDPALGSGSAGNRLMLLAAIILVALIIGLALAFLIDYLDDRLRSAEEVVELLELPVYGELPRAPRPGERRGPPAPVS
ncbi:YveK family protein [Thermogemmatispora sp.]|uniref:YveK family protein n=1 Tax=Thermogemmatispora sp. TaxID=1968838 RepID=UPI001D8DA857|nr:hypothetical protein [Thermogemmatispora sp.]MBX5451890.1 hypothetical protein [Thermogemmatispora sp.]